jgi:hypothetical protein
LPLLKNEIIVDTNITGTKTEKGFTWKSLSDHLEKTQVSSFTVCLSFSCKFQNFKKTMLTWASLKLITQVKI